LRERHNGSNIPQGSAQQLKCFLPNFNGNAKSQIRALNLSCLVVRGFMAQNSSENTAGRIWKKCGQTNDKTIGWSGRTMSATWAINKIPLKGVRPNDYYAVSATVIQSVFGYARMSFNVVWWVQFIALKYTCVMLFTTWRHSRAKVASL